MAHDVVLTETLVATLKKFEQEDTKRVIKKLEDIRNFPDHFLDHLKNHPGYTLRVGDFRVLIDWNKDNEMLHAIDAFDRKNEYRELGKYHEVWGYGATTRTLEAMTDHESEFHGGFRRWEDV